ncbi:MAG: hypothetical protein J0M08_07320 [Bacteroidetes bacterium]|nr:hypothetical protein [Bacteroidota bacterium]
MKTTSTLSLFLFSTLLFSQYGNRFDWLIGTWHSTMDGSPFTEIWLKKENTYYGKAFILNNTDTVFSETLRIEKIDNHWVFIASINHSAPTLFTLIENDTNTLIFENKEHDFPNKVVYENKGHKNMIAWIEGKVKGETKKEEYLYTKVK